MESGYSVSPMADLFKEYHVQLDDEVSLYHRVVAFAHKKILEKSDVLDRGTYVDPSTDTRQASRFGLETGLLMRVTTTVTDLQNILARAAALVVGRSSVFQVDPHRSLYAILRSATTLGELQAAWAAVSERIGLGHQNLQKYQAEYRARTEEDLIATPASTAPELYQ
ncbi:hypothetical protein R3P38DRAFT_2543895, partial [Favolaschia claudopus]